ncbi:MAG: right-handed parallel beta-helix repeat-containing protein, partial [Verrucomicrobiota bacterium]
MKTPLVRRILGLIGLFVASSLPAATFHVATNGSDSHPGSLTQPFATFNRAVSAVAPGDTVLVRGGVYAQTVNLWAQGTSFARVVFQSYPGETAILDGSTLPANTTLVTISGDWVDWKGFEVRHATRTGITIWEASQVRLLQNSVHHCWNGGIFVGGTAFGLTTDNRVEGNAIYQNCQVNAAHTATSGWPAAIGSQWTDRLTVVDNTVFENHGEGMAFTLADQGLAEGNTVHDNYSVGIYLDNAQFTTVRSNFILSTGNTTFYRSGYPANGISMANEFYSGSHPLTDNNVSNNLILGGKRCIYSGNYDAGGGLKNTLIAHNTCLNGVLSVLGIEADPGHAGTVVANNIFRQTLVGVPLVTVVNNGITFHHNSWSGGSPGLAAGTGDVLADPLLVNPGGFTDTDYRLQAGSPCLLAAADLPAVPDDYWGAFRTSPRDMGAHELSAGPATGPAAPSNLGATAAAYNRVNLAWTDHASDEDGFRVERSTDGVNFSLLATLGANVTAFADTTVSGSIAYQYRVRAFNASGNSAWSNTAGVTTPAAPPAAPTNLTATALAKRKIRLNWTDNANNESGFRIERS